MSRTTASVLLAAAVLALLVGAFFLGWQLADDRPGEPETPDDVARPPETVGVDEDTADGEPLPDHLVLRPAELSDLPGFGDDQLAAAMPALDRSCLVWRRRAASAPVGPDGIGGTVGLWIPFCDAILGLGPNDTEAVREALEEHLTPWTVTNRGETEGLFTGYYEPTLQGSRRRGGRYQVPLYKTPSDMVAVDLGNFRDDLDGRKITGRIAGNRFLPYHDREAIDRGALAGRSLELVWVDSAVDAFFLEIQGSGRVEMDDGSTLRLGYAGQNGHPYYAIGRELVSRGHMEVEDVSMQSIRRHLEANPDEGAEIMRTNASYVFFRQLTGPGPLGSMGVALTPGRSLAIDQSILPLGAPVWLAAEAPAPTPAELAQAGDSAEAIEETQRLERLMVGQDTGGAIEGPVRGDVFWGPGDEAADVAGRMKHAGRLWLFLPQGFEPPELPDPAAED